MSDFPPVRYNEDDGTMPDNAKQFAEAIVGHKIVSVERDPDVSRVSYWGSKASLRLTLDNGDKVTLFDTDDCCAFTELYEVITHLPFTDHIITRVSPALDYNVWHILADFGEVMELRVGWSCGNPFYYGYGFEIHVEKPEEG